MGRKKLFSLIEIAVAMAVAAIGVAAIMALLPVAVKSTSDSVGDTLAADAANTVFAKLDTYAWIGAENTDGRDIFDAILSLPTTKPGPRADIIDLAGENKTMGANTSYEFIPAGEEGHWLLLFGQSGEKPDFEAEVICWRDPGNDIYLSVLEPQKTTPNPVQLSKYAHLVTNKQAFVRVYVEITWPARRPYAVKNSYPRQSRLFVREYLDPTYTNHLKED
jgi:type II secretory pathway pseudopilin PulG